MSWKLDKTTARWFEPWSWAVWDAAYALIVRAGEGDAKAKGELDAIRKHAARGNKQAVMAKRRFDAVAKLVEKGLSKPSEFVRQHKTQRPDKRSDSLQRPGAAQAYQRQEQEAEKKRRERASVIHRAQALRRAQMARTQAYEEQLSQADEALAQRDSLIAQRDSIIAQRQQQDILEAALDKQAAMYEAKLEAAQQPPASGLPTGSNENPAPIDIGPSGSAPGDVEFGE